MKRVMVIGGSGFIGSNLVEQLVKLNYYVINYDLKEAYPKIANENIQEDILEESKLKNAMRNVDIVCHLAARVGVVDCIQHENEVYRTNVEGVKNVINCCKKNNIHNVLFASSSEVYGEGYLDKRLIESLSLHPKSVYGETKLEAERLFAEFSKECAAKVSVLRYSNVYGSRQRKEFIVPIFINQVLEHKDLTICGDGTQTRCFTYVSDAVEGTIKAILRKKGELFEIFNICSDFSYTVKEVADIVLSCSDMKPKIKYCSFQDVNRKEEYEVYNRILSSEKGKRILDYQAKIPLEDGVKRTFEFYKRESELLR